MGTTNGAVGVGLDAIVTTLVTRTLEARDGLPRVGRGHKAPSSEAAAQVLKEMGQGRSREWARLMTVARCNMHDGVDVEVVVAPFLLAVAALRQDAKPRTDRPLAVVQRLETKAQAALDLAQLRLAESPESIAAHEAVLAEHAHYATHFNELGESVRDRLVVLTGQPRPTYGARRGHLQSMA